jgi:uncharacterized protein GlcG (DUF336 family)
VKLTSAQAASALEAARAEAARLGVAANIAILDDGAHLKAFDRMDGAVLGSIEVSLGKARTSVLFGIPSEAVWDYCRPGAPAPGLELSNGGLMTFPGGLPLTKAGGLIGAIGVSGGSPEQDGRIAHAGANALA